MGKYFGTDSFRGEANVDLTVEHAYQVGRFLGWYYGKDKKDGGGLGYCVIHFQQNSTEYRAAW